MIFTPDTTDPRHVIATDYWESPPGKAGKPVISFSANCFRLFFPVKASLGERYAQLGIVMDAISKTQYPEIVAAPDGVSVVAGAVALKVSWPEVEGITLADFPPHNHSCDFAAYTYYGKKGPKISFRRKATYSQAATTTPDKA